MKPANETHPVAWSAYRETLRLAQYRMREVEDANLPKNAPKTMEEWQFLRDTQKAAVSAVQDWREAAARLYEAMGIPL